MLIGLAWLLSQVVRLALSRSRALLADARSVELTKNPDAPSPSGPWGDASDPAGRSQGASQGDVTKSLGQSCRPVRPPLAVAILGKISEQSDLRRPECAAR